MQVTPQNLTYPNFLFFLENSGKYFKNALLDDPIRIRLQDYLLCKSASLGGKLDTNSEI